MSDPLLTVIGDLVEDVVVWPARDIRHGTDNPSVVVRTRGGSAANVAVAAATVVAATAESPLGSGGSIGVRFVGRVGDDVAGARLTSALVASGVDARVQIGEGGTGTVVVVVDADGAERTMFNDRGAGAGLTAVDDDALAGTDVLHLPLYPLAEQAGAALLVDVARRVRAAGGDVSVDVSAVTLIESVGADRFRAVVDELAPAWVFANRQEADALGLLAGAPPPGRHHVVKDGPRPVVVSSRGGLVEVAAPAVTSVRDTTGAGDAFAAGFLVAVLAGTADRTARGSGVDVAAACAAGHRSAAAILASPGATPPS